MKSEINLEKTNPLWIWKSNLAIFMFLFIGMILSDKIFTASLSLNFMVNIILFGSVFYNIIVIVLVFKEHYSFVTFVSFILSLASLFARGYFIIPNFLSIWLVVALIIFSIFQIIKRSH